MKIIKNSIAGLMMLAATQTMANNADLAKSTFEQKLQQYTLESSLHQVEQKLIRDYLTEAYQEDVTMVKEDLIRIYNINGKLVYQGNKDNAEDLVENSSHLFDHEDAEYYLIAE